MITVYPSLVYADSTGALVVLSAQPNRAVTWQLTGPGTLTPYSSVTDALGNAAAKFVPSGVGQVTIQVHYGS